MIQTRLQTVAEALMQENIDLKEHIAQHNETIDSLTASLQEYNRILDNTFAMLEDTEQMQEEALEMLREAKDLIAEYDTPLKASVEQAKHANIMAQFDANLGRYGVEDFGDDDEEDTDEEFEGTSFYDKLRERIREQIQQPNPYITAGVKNGQPYEYTPQEIAEDFPRAYQLKKNPSILESLQDFLAVNPELVSSLVSTLSSLILGDNFTPATPNDETSDQEPPAEELHDCGCRKLNRAVAVDEDLTTLMDGIDFIGEIFSEGGFIDQSVRSIVPIIKKRPDLVPVALERAMSIIPALLASTPNIAD